MVKLTLHFTFVQKETSNLSITYITKLCAKYDAAQEHKTCMILYPLHHSKLVLADCVRCPWLQAETKVATILGNFCPSGVSALPLAAGINVGGHYFW